MTKFLKSIFNLKMLITFLLGFSSGLPLLLTGGTLQAMMKDANVDLGTIGLFSLVGLPYTLKFLIAPFFDRFAPPIMRTGDRRKGWILIFQLALIVTIAPIGFFSSVQGSALWFMGILAFATAIFSSLQDIVVDAHRREFFEDNELGMASALFINGYRVAMIASGAIALYMADIWGWKSTYLLMALFMLIGIIGTILAPNTIHDAPPPRTLKDAIVEPFKAYFTRDNAVLILMFILLYKIGDTMAAAMTTPFVLDIGFTKSELATIVKVFGMIATITGGLVGGGVLVRLGINRGLWIFGICQMLATTTFALLAMAGKSHPMLATAIFCENFASGMGTSAYAAFMASITDKRFTATQYALLSSLMGIPRVLVASPTGFIAENLGWINYFFFCALMAIPGILLLLKFAPWKEKKSL